MYGFNNGYIGRNAFRGCENLVQVNITGEVEEIGNWAFASCTSLREITLPDSVAVIGEYAFWRCKSLTNITLPKIGTTKIGNTAFLRCDGLADQNGLIIVQNILYDCVSFTREVTIPSTVIKINTCAFETCKFLCLHVAILTNLENSCKME